MLARVLYVFGEKLLHGLGHTAQFHMFICTLNVHRFQFLYHTIPLTTSTQTAIYPQGHRGITSIMTVTELPVVQSFPSSAPPDEVVEAIKLSGGCIIKGLLSNSDIKQIEQDIRPYIEADVPWVGKFFPRETRRVYGLVGKSETVAQKLVLNPLYQAVSDVFLKERYWNWSGDEKMQNISHPQLHNSIAFSIGPGAKAQPLHRDDHCHLVLNPRIDVYPEDPAQSRRDTALGLFVAGKRATKENGATR